MIDKAITQKDTIRTGRAIGRKNRAVVSIKVNDEDRNVSRLWEIVKRYYSRRKQTAAETARRAFLRGLIAEAEDIMLQQDQAGREALEMAQIKLFE